MIKDVPVNDYLAAISVVSLTGNLCSISVMLKIHQLKWT